MKKIITGAALALALAGCGSASAGSGADSMKAIGNQDNVTVCQHYRIQRAWVKSIVSPTIADAMKLETDVAADSAQATPGSPLAKALNTMSADEQGGKSSYTASKDVVLACEALGVSGW